MTLEHAEILIVVESYVANATDLISKELHMALIGFNVVFEHLLRPKIDFKVMAVLLEFLRDIALIDFMAHPNICGKDGIGFPQQFQSVIDGFLPLVGYPKW